MQPPDPASVPVTFINTSDQIADLAQALAAAERVAIDTEVPIGPPGAGELRVMSVATRARDQSERAFVVDARDVDPVLLAPVLAGVTADAWNASFDARVLDAAVWSTADTTSDLVWFDVQLADALVHQGQSGFTWFHGLAWATEHYLGLVADGKGTVQLSYTRDDDLTSDQIAYAAADAVETLWVGDAVRAVVAQAGLDEICEIENAARPFLDQMERSGLPFDWAGWEGELAAVAARHRVSLSELAALTGGGQGTLFDDVVEPTWNPASDQQVRHALNTWSPDQVRAWTASRHRTPRLLRDGDSVTASVLREIGGELSAALLAFRNAAKILSTYGESIRDHIGDDGRLHPQYLQVVGTNTGRLASRNPNAQNFTPLMKPFVRPADAKRVFVHADLSQAELRFLAQVSDDAALRAAFARGDDVHTTTAATMFRFDPAALVSEDPARLAELRQIAKALNFGIAYGTGAAALARSLTANGSPTSLNEGRDLLRQYRATYPGTDEWANERIAEIRATQRRSSEIDWKQTLRLSRGFGSVHAFRRQFRSEQRRWPTADEVVDAVSDPAIDGRDAATIRWILGHHAAVALHSDGSPFVFASRTVAGRRQQFNVHIDRVLLAAIEALIASPEASIVRARAAFEADHEIRLTSRTAPLERRDIERVLVDRDQRQLFVESAIQRVGADVVEPFLARAARERIGAMVNAWRNAPIQGGVADIMLVAYAGLRQRLAQFGNAVPVQTVHDSVVVECDDTDASAVMVEVKAALEQASLRFCPDVVPLADVDIRTSLSDSDVVSIR